MIIGLFIIITIIFIIIFYKFFYIKNCLNERLYLSFLTTLFMIIFAAFFLMRFGIFDINFLLLMLLICLTTLVLYYNYYYKRSDHIVAKETMSLSHQAVFFIFLLALMMFYALFPTYYMLGGRDPGLYFLYSVHIANTGGLNLDLPILRELYKNYGDAIQLGYPGIYSAFDQGLSEDPAQLIPQFMQLFPVFGAIAYKLAGIEGVVRANSIIAVFALWSFFLVTKRLVGFYPALLAMIALGINAAFIWNARITLTETLSIAFLFSGLLFLIKAFERCSVSWSFAAGTILGLAILNRLDASLNSLIIFSIFLTSLHQAEYYSKISIAAFLAYLVFSSLAFLDGFFHTYPYLHDLWIKGSLKGLVLINYTFPILGLLIFYFSKLKIFSFLKYKSTIFLSLKILISLLAAWMLFAYFVWPQMEDSFNARALKELGWYVTPLLFFLTVVGLFSSFKYFNIQPVIFSLIILSTFSIFIFTWRPSITPDHIWASRRWLPQVIPLIILFSTLSLTEFYKKSSLKFIRLFSVFSILFYIVSSILLAKPYIFHSLYKESKEGYSSIQEFLQTGNNNDLLFTKELNLASIITYVYRKETVVITDKAFETIHKDKLEGYSYLGFDDFSPGKILLRRANICGSFLEKVRGDKPKSLYQRCYNANIGILSYTGFIYYRALPTNSRFGTLVGSLDYVNHTINSTSASGFLLFGPYIYIPAGRYEVVWYGGSHSDLKGEIGFVDVVFNRGKDVIVRESFHISDFKSGKITALEFETQSAISDLEFRFFINKNIDIYISEIEFRQISE